MCCGGAELTANLQTPHLQNPWVFMVAMFSGVVPSQWVSVVGILELGHWNPVWDSLWHYFSSKEDKTLLLAIINSQEGDSISIKGQFGGEGNTYKGKHLWDKIKRISEPPNPTHSKTANTINAFLFQIFKNRTTTKNLLIDLVTLSSKMLKLWLFSLLKAIIGRRNYFKYKGNEGFFWESMLTMNVKAFRVLADD